MIITVVLLSGGTIAPAETNILIVNTSNII